LLLPLFASAATLNNTFNVGTLFPAIGATTSVSSNCGASAAYSNISFALMQNGVYTSLSTSLSADQNGAFTGNVVFPSSITSGSATLIATCGSTGNTINSPVLTFAAPASTSFSLPGQSPTVGGIYNLSGACGSSSESGTAQLTLNQNGTNYNLDNVSLNSAATFSDNVAIPSTTSDGPATLTAVCSNGTRFSSNVNIGTAAVNSFAFSSSPFPGVSTTVSGSCTNISGNQNGTTGFALLRNGGMTTLSATNDLTNSSGYFNSSVFFPSTVGSQPATFVVTCPNGSTFSNVIMLGAANLADPTDPVGGVAAGSDPQETANYFIAAGILVITGLLGLLAVTRKNLYVQK
jgi:hypothetical protein